MDLPLIEDLLCQRWVHSRAEDSPTEEVYRPANSPLLQPSRKLTGYEFKPDGTVNRLGSGPTDIPQAKQGTWQIDEAKPDEIHVEIGGRDDVLKIQDLAPDRLAIQKSS
jgi:hypothetical protein